MQASAGVWRALSGVFVGTASGGSRAGARSPRVWAALPGPLQPRLVALAMTVAHGFLTRQTPPWRIWAHQTVMERGPRVSWGQQRETPLCTVSAGRFPAWAWPSQAWNRVCVCVCVCVCVWGGGYRQSWPDLTLFCWAPVALTARNCPPWL